MASRGIGGEENPHKRRRSPRLTPVIPFEAVMKTDYDRLRSKFECKEHEFTDLVVKYESVKEELMQLKKHNLKAGGKNLREETVVKLEERLETVISRTEILESHLAEAQIEIQEKEETRRKMHNKLMELKGNIRVFCRVRLGLPEDGPDAPVISYPPSTEGHEDRIAIVCHGQVRSFAFDKVFTQQASQDNVFVEISELVQSALDGYKVCIFAYGQTGSGKTYTMMGRPESLDQRGLIPRSLEQIFQTSLRLSNQGWKYHMQASILEIYNETIHDLLAPNRPGGGSFGVPRNLYAIKHDANGNTYVSGLTTVDVGSSTEAASLLKRAAQQRSVGRTQMNEQSSRSHFVFTLHVSAMNETTKKHGILNLIDLAGSERLSDSGSTGYQLKETQAINKSLSSLSDVILALGRKDSHIPFRNSKLTHLLEPCLSGDSKTLMFVNVSPDPRSVNESVNSLLFADRVKFCKVAEARRRQLFSPGRPPLTIPSSSRRH